MTTNHLLRTATLAPEDREEENVAIPVGRFVGPGPCYVEKSNFLNWFCLPDLGKFILLEGGVWGRPAVNPGDSASVLIPSDQGARGTRARWPSAAWHARQEVQLYPGPHSRWHLCEMMFCLFVLMRDQNVDSMKIEDFLTVTFHYTRCSGWFLKSSASLSFLIS